MSYFLVIDSTGREFSINHGTTIGGVSDCDIQLIDPTAAAVFARFILQQECLYIEDPTPPWDPLISPFPYCRQLSTIVDGQQLRGLTRCVSGTVLEFGDIRCTVVERRNILLIDEQTMDPNNPMTFITLASFAATQGDYAKAIDLCTKAIQMDPSQTKAFGTRGVARGELGDPLGEISDYCEAIRLDPSYCDAYVNRAVAYS